METQSSQFSQGEIQQEAKRLQSFGDHLGWSADDCALYAPLTLEINALKKKHNAIILAHSYQLPEIIYGVADFVGDSYGLSKKAVAVTEDTIIFSGVIFMAETAKILNPTKRVFVPSPTAGCSLADSITAKDVLALRKQYPDAAVACYVNTTATVKAVCDVCFTSANAVTVINSLPQEQVICIPDALMAKNLIPLTKKTLIPWTGTCIVHERFSAESVRLVKKHYPQAKILVHTECTSDVVAEADLAGGTTDMVDAVKTSEPGSTFMIVTECGLADRMRVEYPDRTFVGTCQLCPYMKQNTLRDILQVLQLPRDDQEIILDTTIITQAKRSLDAMFLV